MLRPLGPLFGQVNYRPSRRQCVPLRRVGAGPAGIGYHRAVWLADLGLGRRHDRSARGDDRHGAECLACHKSDSADPRSRPDLSCDPPAFRRLRRDRDVFGRHHGNPRICAYRAARLADRSEISPSGTCSALSPSGSSASRRAAARSRKSTAHSSPAASERGTAVSSQRPLRPAREAAGDRPVRVLPPALGSSSPPALAVDPPRGCGATVRRPGRRARGAGRRRARCCATGRRSSSARPRPAPGLSRRQPGAPPKDRHRRRSGSSHPASAPG
jgi:hypothetical protein